MTGLPGTANAGAVAGGFTSLGFVAGGLVKIFGGKTLGGRVCGLTGLGLLISALGTGFMPVPIGRVKAGRVLGLVTGLGLTNFRMALVFPVVCAGSALGLGAPVLMAATLASGLTPSSSGTILISGDSVGLR